MRRFQQRVGRWVLACFGFKTAKDKKERCFRFLEEALELVQSLGCNKQEALKLLNYVYSREEGRPSQEVGGVMVTLSALCEACDIDLQSSAETELKRIEHPDIMKKIQEKQLSKILQMVTGDSVEEDRTSFLVLELHGGPEYAAICTNQDGENLVFDSLEKAEQEAADCQEGRVIEC